MVAKFHFNPATGEVGVCTATTRPCAYGADSHGSTREKTQAKYESLMERKAPVVLSKSPKGKKEKHRAPANPEMAAAMREIRRSSAASSHDTRPKRQRSRKDAKNAAIRDQKI